MYFFAINVGIGMAYHRLLTHRGYRTPKWVEYFVTACGTWRLRADRSSGSPPTASIIRTPTTKATPTLRTTAPGGLTPAGSSPAAPCTPRPRCSAATLPTSPATRVHVWLSKYHWLPLTIAGFLQIALGAALAAPGHRIVGALGMVLWGTFLRVTIGLHATWLVNSATHLWGKRRFETKDDSRNNWWVALLTGGEGWHNNHHAHPVSARHGLAWYEFDINYYGIWFLSKIGLAEKVQIAKFDPKNPKPAGVN